MLCAMFFRCNKQKVLWPVVLCVAIFVMNMQMRRRFGNNAVLVFPNIRLSNFDFNVHKPVTCFVQSFVPNRPFAAYLLQNAMFGFQNIRIQGFSCAITTARRVMVRLAVRSWFAYDRALAIRAKFLHRWAHRPIVYQA